MKRLPHALLLLTILLVAASCSREKDPVIPAYSIKSHQGLIIQLEWSTGGTPGQAIAESDLDLYLDLGTTPIAASEQVYHFEEVQLRDVYRDGTYDVYIGAIDISRTTDYEINIFAPDGSTIHRFPGYFLRGDQGEVHYLRIRKEGPYYTFINL